MKEQVIKKVSEDEKQSWQSIAFIWIGTMICIPMLMVGAMLTTGLNLSNILTVAFIGFLICSVIMCFGGMQATDLGYPATMCASKAFGDSGSRVVVSLIVAIAQAGWFAVQTATCGSAFSQLLLTCFNFNMPLWISSFIWGIVMLITAVYGFKFMKILNYIAVPALIALCIFGVFMSMKNFQGSVFAYTPSENSSMAVGISTMIGLFAMGTVINGDYTRYAKSRRDTVKASILGVLPAAVLMIGVGAIMSIATGGESDITKLFASLGFPILSMLVLILATWTTNTGNAYNSGLAVLRLFNISEEKRSIITLIVGLIGTIMAMFGFANFLSPFLNVLGVCVPPIAGVLIADYWIIGKGDKDNWKIVRGFNYAGIISWIIASVFSYFVTIFSKSLDSILISMILYLILAKVIKTKEEIKYEG
ncbi:MAG: cytosine permease [Clostridioides sp.]|jgi:cytosine permease|nr:cytosine permease [Clostridioides sp.]